MKESHVNHLGRKTSETFWFLQEGPVMVLVQFSAQRRHSVICRSAFQLAEAASKYQVRNSVSCGLKFRPGSVTIRELLQVEKAVIPLVHICP